jgi:DNA-binding NtrC family response regulator
MFHRCARRISGLERQAVEQAMRATGGNKMRAARQLGISRMQLYGRLRKLGFESV